MLRACSASATSPGRLRHCRVGAMSQVPFQFFYGRRRLALVLEQHEPSIQVRWVVARVVRLGFLQEPSPFATKPASAYIQPSPLSATGWSGSWVRTAS